MINNDAVQRNKALSLLLDLDREDIVLILSILKLKRFVSVNVSPIAGVCITQVLVYALILKEKLVGLLVKAIVALLK